MLFVPAAGARLESASGLTPYVAGAESNVACGLAHLGHDVEWFGRIGQDPFGARILGFLTGRGVTVSRVITDRSRPTGIYFKDYVGGQSKVYYYRSGSAASGLSRADLGGLGLDRRALCHVSGITAALSPTCDDLLQRMVIDRDPRVTVSFDVNYRPGLWDVATAAPRLLELARAADIVMVGRDEADILWSTGDAGGVRELMPNVPQLVVKDAQHGATHFGEAGTTFVPALSIDVVEPIGAGDAFAAGFLSGWLRGWEAEPSMRLGHVMAGITLQAVSDLPELPAASAILALAERTGAEWGELDLTVPVADIQVTNTERLAK